MHFPQALKSIEYLEEDAQKPFEEAVPEVSDSDSSRWNEEPSQLEELADFMGQVQAFLFWVFNLFWRGGLPHGMWKFLGQGLNPRHSCHLQHNCSNEPPSHKRTDFLLKFFSLYLNILNV